MTDLFSKTEALELAAGNAQLANELTKMLIEELPTHLQQINAALSADNIKELKQKTHKLHGATRCCGAVALRNSAKQLESDIDQGALEKIAASTQHLTDEIKRLIKAEQNDLML